MFDKRKYYTAVLLDIAEAFDKVWHEGLLYKLKKFLPTICFIFLRSYPSNRKFYVKEAEATSAIQNISAGVPQASVLGSILYLLYTADFQTPSGVVIGTFVDDTAILSTQNWHHQIFKKA